MSKNFGETAKGISSNESIIPNKSCKSEDKPTRGKERKKASKKKLSRTTNKRRLSGGADDGPEDNTGGTNRSVRMNDSSMGGPQDNTAGTNRSVRMNDSSMGGPEDNASRSGPVDHHSRSGPVDQSGPVDDHSRSGPVDDHSRSGPVDQHSRSGPVDQHSRSGPVDQHSRSGPVDPHSRSGPVDQHSRSGPVDPHSRSGPVDIHQSGMEGPVDHHQSRSGMEGPVDLHGSTASRPVDNRGGTPFRSAMAGPVDLHASTPSGPMDNRGGTPFRSALDGPEDNVGHEGPVDLHPGQALPSTGDARVDEMLDCALQNLSEANLALANLGENLEHDLKLSLVELINRTRKWTSQVESKIEWSRKDILNLHQELAKIMAALKESRRESAMLRNQLNTSEAAKSMAESSLNESMRNGPQKFDNTGQLLVMSGFHGGPSSTGGHDQQHQSSAPSAVRSVQLEHQSGLLSPRSQSRSHIMSAAIGKTPGSLSPPELATIHAEEERLQGCCAELEAEVQELRKENERIVKERAEYENAIQRALLKGVSSLNVEALKVLRCSPIPNCCTPCPPSSTIEPVSKPQYCSTPLNNGGMKSPNGNDNKACNNGKTYTATSGCRSHNGSREALYSGNGNGRRVCPSAGHHQERKQRKSRDNNMLLLLHQKDAESYGIQTGSNCCDNAAKKNSAYGGGNCGKYSKSSYNC